MTDYAETLRQHVRLAILRALVKLPGYSSNDSVLADALTKVGLRQSRDAVKVEIDWLAEQGLVRSEPAGYLIAVTATQRGHDVAIGHATVTGVRRPSAAP